MELFEPVITGSLTITGSLLVSGSISSTGGITISGSITSASFATTSSYSVSSSYALSGSYSLTATTASNSLTASSADNFVVRQNVTASNMLATGRITAQTLLVQTVTSSIVYSSGSNIFGCSQNDVQQFTGSLRVTGSGAHYIQTGCVGIGTTSPNYDLHIQNSSIPRIQLTNTVTGTTTGDGLHIYQSGGDSYLINKETSSLLLGANNSVVMAITGSNVGIGTSTPAASLEVSSNGGRVRITQNIVGSTFNGIDFYNYVGGNGASILMNQSTGEVRYFASASGYFPTFYSNNCEAIRITTAGNVGIGTPSPASKVDINIGNLSTAGAYSNAALNLYNPTNVGAYSQITFGYSIAGTYAMAYMGLISTNQASYGYGDLVFGTRAVSTDTQPTERMRITSCGDTELVKTCIVGVTNSVSNTLKFRHTQTNAQSVIAGTIYTTSPGSWGGDMVFTTHPSNATPDDNTTERLRINSAGNVLINTSCTCKGLLRVSGSAEVTNSLFFNGGEGTGGAIINAGAVTTCATPSYNLQTMFCFNNNQNNYGAFMFIHTAYVASLAKQGTVTGIVTNGASRVITILGCALESGVTAPGVYATGPWCITFCWGTNTNSNTKFIALTA